MDQTRPLRCIELQGVEHGVEMTLQAGAALHRQTRGLVDREDIVIPVENRCPQGPGLMLGNRGGWALARRGRWRLSQRRNADLLPRLESRIRPHAPALDAALAGAQQFLQPAVVQLGEATLEPAVEAKTGFVGGNGDGLHATHGLPYSNAGVGRRRESTYFGIAIRRGWGPPKPPAWADDSCRMT